MATQLTPAEWLAILQNPELTHDKDIEILQAINDLGGKASAGEITKLVGYSNVVSVNSNMRFYALRIAKTRKIHFSRNTNNKSGYRYWNFFFKGRQEGDAFIWELRKNLFKALNQLPALPDRGTFISPEEMSSAEAVGYPEGAKKRITVNAYERNRKARDQCLAHYGYDCAVCGMNFEKVYGDKIGKEFIHVHHLVPLSEIQKNYVVDGVNDLVPVCPNCHAMLHRHTSKPRSIEELKAIMKKAAQAKA